MIDSTVHSTARDPERAALSGNPFGDFKAMEIFRAMAGTVRRSLMGRLLGFGGRRNYNKIFGWDDVITPEMMHAMYNRGGIAARLVDAIPEAVWSRPPQIWAEGDATWTAAWEAYIGDPLVSQKKFWNTLSRLDKLANLGHYAVLVVGTNKAGLERPLTRADEVRFLQPYSEVSAKVIQWERDSSSPRFGQPLMYRIYPDAVGGIEGSSLGSGYSQGDVGPTRTSFRVHASRILHVARGGLEDTVFGKPIMAASWDYLTDLRKVVGASSESYWLMANRGLQANVDKEMVLSAPDEAALESEVDEFLDGYRRFMRTKGIDIKELKNDVANPKDPFDVLVTLISGTSGIPKRILLGSEAGSLASTQDKGNWAERVEENRSLYVEPMIIGPYVHMLIDLGILPKPQGKIMLLWPDAYRMSPLERAQTQAQTARSMANVTKMLESRNPRAANLLSDVEHRALLGFGSDNRILEDDPQP